MTIRAIDFPDHTDPSFNSDEIFEAPNGVEYKWNGAYGWEVVCKGSGGSGGSGGDYDDEWIKDDQKRQDDELTDYKGEVTLEQQRQDKDLAAYKDEQVIDQQRQDDELQDLKDEIWPDFDDPCPEPEVSAQLKFGEYGNGMDADVVYFSSTPSNGKSNLLCVPDGVHGGNWPFPSSVDSIWINKEEYVVTESGNISGVHWKYYLDRDIDYSLQNTVVEFRLCEPFNPPAAIFVTHEEFALNQQSQDEVFAKEHKHQNDALDAEIEARAERDALHDSQLATIEYKLDALVGIQFRGDYVFKHDTDCDAAYAACMAAAAGDVTAGQQCARDMLACQNDKVSSGTFEAVDPDDRFDHLEAIVIHKNALDGEELEWDSILKAGDYLEIDHRGADGLDKQNYGLYRLTADPVEATNAVGEPVFDMQLEFLQGEGQLTADETFEVRGISATEGISPEELGDFLLKDEAANTYALKGHTHDDYIRKEADNSTYKDWLLLADGNKKSPTHYAGANHAHGWTDITGKPATYEPAPHSHSGYASSSHTHSGYASSSHTHSGYASSSHNHNSSYVKGNYTISKDSYGNYYIQ